MIYMQERQMTNEKMQYKIFDRNYLDKDTTFIFPTDKINLAILSIHQSKNENTHFYIYSKLS